MALKQTPDQEPELVESVAIEAHKEFPDASYVSVPDSEQFPIRGDFTPLLKTFCEENGSPIPTQIRADKWAYFLIYDVTGMLRVDRWNKKTFLELITNGLRVNFEIPAVHQLCVEFAPRQMTPKEVIYWQDRDEQEARNALAYTYTTELEVLLLGIRNAVAADIRRFKRRNFQPGYRGRGFVATWTILNPPSPSVETNAPSTMFEKFLAATPFITRARKRSAQFEDVEPLAKRLKPSPLAAIKKTSSEDCRIKRFFETWLKDGVRQETTTFHGIKYEVFDVDNPVLPLIKDNNSLVIHRAALCASDFYFPFRPDPNSRLMKLRKLIEILERLCDYIVRIVGKGVDNRKHITCIVANEDCIWVLLNRLDDRLEKLDLLDIEWDKPISSWGRVSRFTYEVAKFPESICMEQQHEKPLNLRHRFKESLAKDPIRDCVSRAHGLSCGC